MPITQTTIAMQRLRSTEAIQTARRSLPLYPFDVRKPCNVHLLETPHGQPFVVLLQTGSLRGEHDVRYSSASAMGSPSELPQTAAVRVARSGTKIALSATASHAATPLHWCARGHANDPDPDLITRSAIDADFHRTLAGASTPHVHHSKKMRSISTRSS